ncbi:MAG TPA: DNA polymerase III subunit alpha [Candidatus Paceibacterota bacterium]
MRFTHLHVHSHYSLLQALPKISELVEAAKKDGMEALALTDNGNLYGAIEFYKECKKAEIKPIIGVDCYVASRTRLDKQAGVDKDRTRLILLAENIEGYKNLLKIVTASYIEGFYYKPRIDKDLLEKHNNGLICISSSWSGDVSNILRRGDEEGARELIEWYQKIFGEKFFIELTHHPEMPGHSEHMKKLYGLAIDMKVLPVASQDVYYINPEDKKARETLMAVMQGAPPSRSERGGFDEHDEDFSFTSQEEMQKRFKDMPQALEGNEKVVSMCNIELELGKWVFPDLKLPSGKSHDDELTELTYAGIEKRGLEKSKEVEERLEYELGIIKKKGYSPYFLVVADLLRYAHENGILTTIRGSVAGSLTTYCVGITNVNPLEYKLPFERFLNPERPSAPDIDMDYADDRRDEMIAYAKQKYGDAHVAQIGTFGTMMARGSVRDTARALGFSYGAGDMIAKLIPMGAQGFPMTIDRAMKENPDLAELYKKDEDTRTIIDMAKKIEGCARHISVHAAGVVISPTPLTDFVPLQFDTKSGDHLITQYDMHAVEEAGLLKFDFLGIKNLAILADAVRRVKKIENIEVNIESIPLDDKKTFEMLALGETIGLFQLNGSGMTRFLKELKPSTIHDINAMVALYRPGPMETIPEYIERKHNPELVVYEDPRMKEYLEFSNGLLVYQDDVLMTSIKLGGYSWLDADKLRKAIGKKIPEVMAAEKEKLIKGFIEYGKLSKKLAEKLWKLIEPFAAYGFGKAHAASYGKVAYQTAYMKANFPEIYMSAVLTADSGDVEKIAETISECTRMGIPVLPPDINESFAGFSVVKPKEKATTSHLLPVDLPVELPVELRGASKIRFGLTTIKNFGEGIAETIIEERKKNGKFQSMEDFLVRIQDRNLNKKSLEALVKSGCFDSMGERGKFLAHTERLLEYNKEMGTVNSHNSLFSSVSEGHTPLRLNDVPEVGATERLAWEKELLGLYVSGHPLDKFKEKLESQKMTIKKIKEEVKEGEMVVVGGILEEIKPHLTKNGDKMLFTKIADLTDSIEMAVFPRTLAEFKDIFTTDKCIAIKARVTLRNGEKSLVAEKAKVL